MPRPNKAGLDYFPLDVDMDDKVDLVEAKYGLVGFGIIVKLFQKIYKNSYFVNADDERLLLLKKHINVDINLINDVIEDSCRWEIFDKKIYKKYKILTSRGIQTRYALATKRRKEITFIKEILLLKDPKSLYDEKVNVNIKSINDVINTQSKVNRKKRIKTFVEDSIEFRLANYLFKHIKKNNPNHKEPNLQSWAKHIDLMLRLDKRNPEEAREVIAWCQADPFWAANILSAGKLRQKFDQLFIKMKSKPKDKSQEAFDKFNRENPPRFVGEES